MFVFSGEVEIRREDMTMTCDKVLGYYGEQSIGRESENLEGMMEEIDRIIATGNVRMTRTDGSLGTAEKAVYDLNEEKVVMTGQPVLKQGRNSWEGSELTYHLRERLVSGKNARAVIYTRSEEGVLTGGQ